MNTTGSANLGDSTPVEKPRLETHTAFVVYISQYGDVGFSPDPELLSDRVEIIRTASFDEMYGAMATAKADIDSQRNAVAIDSLMRQQAIAAARSQQDARIASMVNKSRLD